MPNTRHHPVLFIIDDDPAIQVLVEKSLQPYGYDIKQAESGEMALEMFSEIHPELILLDINMPGIDGIETCKRIRALPQGQFVPILILTGSEDIDSINRAYQAGATDFITKPINWPILIHHVRYMLRAGQAIIEQQSRGSIQQLLSLLSDLGSRAFTSVGELLENVQRVIMQDAFVVRYCQSMAIYSIIDRQLHLLCRAGQTGTTYPESLPYPTGDDLFDGLKSVAYRIIQTNDRPCAVLVWQCPCNAERQLLRNHFLDTIGDKVSQLLTHIESELETRLAAEVFSKSLDAIAITDEQGLLLRVNQAFERITGYMSNDVLGKNISVLKSGRQDKLFYQTFWDSLLKTHQWQGEIWNRRKNGDVYPQWLSISGITNNHGQVSKFIAVFADISRQKEQEKRIQHLAYYDNLTGLANRSLLNDHLQLALSQAERSGHAVAVLFIDLDRFKTINDSLGHAVGDQLLAVIGDRLSGMVRESDTVARQGGDEFIVLLTDLPKDFVQAKKIAERVADCALKLLSSPVHLGLHELQVSGSVGIAFYPHDANNGGDLIKHADTAMYAAKQRGRNGFEFFHASMAEKELQRFTLESLLNKAVDKQELSLHYQPQVNLETGRIVGAECLIRWNNEQLGWVSPMNFIPLAEETGLIHSIGTWVMKTACSKLKQWEKSGLMAASGCQYVAVNVSAQQFGQKDFAQNVSQILIASGLNDWSLLELELTEGCVMYSSYESQRTLAQLRSMGIRVSIDDFGTGYSSLSYLRNFPLDTLKIDQSFVKECINDRKSQAIVKGIISIAEGLGLDTIAEGVESPEQLAFLQTHGCRIYQGYLFSKPIAVNEFETMLQAIAPQAKC